MSRRFSRGAVVVRGHRYGVVWQHDTDGLVLLPLLRPERTLGGDVTLELAELLACGAPIAGAAIRVRPIGPLDGADHRQVGTVPGPAMIRVVQSATRLAAERSAIWRWRGNRAHREHARAPRVRM